MADWPEGKAYRIGKDRYGTYHRRRGIEVPWSLFGWIALFVALVIGGIAASAERRSDCASRGGTYLSNGKYGNPTCIKDGKIIVIYKSFGQKVVNP